MSYDKTEAVCPICEKWICLGLDYEVRDGEYLHTECAPLWDGSDGTCDECGAPVPRNQDGTPRYPTGHGSKGGLCGWCVREMISMGTL